MSLEQILYGFEGTVPVSGNVKSDLQSVQSLKDNIKQHILSLILKARVQRCCKQSNVFMYKKLQGQFSDLE